MSRCDWAATEPNVSYHDHEWGRPVLDDQRLFEALILDGAQAGLSWTTILKKREAYRLAYEGFVVDQVAAYTEADVERLMGDPGIVRNQLKVRSSITNARCTQEVQAEFGSLTHYFWSFVDFQPVQNERQSMADIPATSEISDAMSKDMVKRGFKFVGSTILYALMQAVGMVNDHQVSCPQHAICRDLAPTVTEFFGRRGNEPRPRS